MKVHDKEAREMRKRCDDEVNETNMKCAGKCALKIKGKIVTYTIKQVIRITDATDLIKEHIKENMNAIQSS